MLNFASALLSAAVIAALLGRKRIDAYASLPALADLFVAVVMSYAIVCQGFTSRASRTITIAAAFAIAFTGAVASVGAGAVVAVGAVAGVVTGAVAVAVAIRPLA